MSYTLCFYHIIFRTKHSCNTIHSKYERELFKLIWDFCKKKNIFLHRINGTENHLHLSVELPPDYAVAAFVRDLKTFTSLALKENPHFINFTGWASGYCALSYGRSDIIHINNYISNQKTHHTTFNLSDEMLRIFKENGIEIKEEFFKKAWEE